MANGVVATYGEVTLARFTCREHFSCNVYVISSPHGNLVVDPGYYEGDVRDYVRGLGRVDAVLLTHGHWDHIRGLGALLAEFPGTPVYCYRGQGAFLTDTHLNCSELRDFDVVVRGVDVRELDEGPASVAGYRFEVIHTPGHCSGACMYHFAQDGFLIVGDMVLCNEFGTTFRPTGSARELKASVAKVRALGLPDSLPCYCGHRDSTTYGHLRTLLEAFNMKKIVGIVREEHGRISQLVELDALDGSRRAIAPGPHAETLFGRYPEYDASLQVTGNRGIVLVDTRGREVQLVTVAGRFVDFTDAEPVIAKVERLGLRLVNGDILTAEDGSRQFLVQ